MTRIHITLLISLVLMVCLSGPTEAVPLAGDLDGDFAVDIADLLIFSEQWLAETMSADIAPESGDGRVDLADCSRLASAWMSSEGQPGWDSQCDLAPETPDGFINELDLSVFANQWLYRSARYADIAPTQAPDGKVDLLDYVLFAENWGQVRIPLFINEFMAQNLTTLPDSQGQYDDWIEIYNAGHTDIDLAGMYLTDDLDVPAKWRIPAGYPGDTTIAAHGYLLVWADIDMSDGPLHAPFQLDAGGEELALFDTDGITLIDSIEFWGQTKDVSFGRDPDAGDNWVTLSPTPGSSNDGSYLPLVADTKFDIDRGFYDDPFEVKIMSETPGSTIIYTLNGTEPSLTNGTKVSAPNPDAIPIATVQISTTTTLRAASFKENYYPSDTDTHTYIFLDDIISSSDMDTDITQDYRYAPHMRTALTDLPTVSVVSPTNHLEQYILGPYPEWAYDEFPISIEWITSEGSLTFQKDAGASRFGGHWYDRTGGVPFNKWAFRIYFRGEYGTSKLKAPLFEGFDHGLPPTDTFDQLDLRSGSHDMYQRGFYMSSPLTADTMLEMGNVNPHSRFVHLYINGRYWGQYNLHERWNADMVSRYVGGEKEDYESIKTHINQGGWNDMGIAYDGDGSVWEHALTLRNSYEQIKTWVDIQSYIDFMLMWMFGNSEEEYRCVGSKTEDGAGFLFWLNDPDGFTRVIGDRTGSYGPGYIFRDLVAEAHPDFMTFLADRIHEHFFNNGGLTQTAMTEKLLERCGQIETSFFAEAARWGYRTPDSWASARDNYINNILPGKPQELLDDLISRGLYPNVVAPIFYINNSYQHGGMINSGDEFSMSASGGTIYYTFDGSDPRLPDGEANPEALSTASGPSTDIILIQKGSTWNYLDDGSDQGTAWTGLQSNDNSWESGPAQLGYGDGDENTVLSFGPDANNKYPTTYFRHVFNLTEPSQFTALSASLMRDDGAIVYLNGTEIIRSNMSIGTVTYLTPASGRVSGGGESTYYLTTDIDTSILVTGDNIVAVEIHQVDAASSDISFDFELTTTTDSGGVSTKTPIEYSTHVQSRVLEDGKWSAMNQATFGVGDIVGSLRISELMYHPAVDPNSEFIELKNIGTETINLNLIEFANGIDFVFPNIDLAGNDKIVVVRNTAAFEAAYPDFNGVIAGQYTGSLDNDGDRILLQDAIGTVVHDFKFRDGWYGITDGGGFTLTVIDPNNTDLVLYGEKDAWRASTNKGGSPGVGDIGPNPGDIVINEVLAHSDDSPNDWIELYNVSEIDIYIGGWYLSDNNDDDPNLMKYRIDDDTIIAANGYAVFTQDQHFIGAFALSENGDKVCLSSAVGDQLTGYREVESFGASEVDVTLGRHYKASTDTYNFVAMASPTMGTANAYPKVGLIVISKIMYHPPIGGSYDDDEYEFIELYNISGSTVILEEYDAELNVTVMWQFSDGIDYIFPLGTTIDPNERLIIARNIAAFAERYGYSAGVFGPFANETNLSNSGERLQLAKPGDTDAFGVRQYIRIDRVTYSDGSHPVGDDPWPTTPDGGGDFLKRKTLTDYGNDPANWQPFLAL